MCQARQVGAAGSRDGLATPPGGRMKAKPRTKNTKKTAKKAISKAPAKRAVARPQARTPEKRKQANKPAAKTFKSAAPVKPQAKATALKATALKEPSVKEPALIMAPVDGKPIAPDPNAGMMGGVKMATIPVMTDIERKPMPPLPPSKRP